ncbi:hypothetical protein GCM10009679_26770 [Saccharothrix algeriensis]
MRLAAPGDQVGDGDALGDQRRLRQHAEPLGDLARGQVVQHRAVEQHAAAARFQEPAEGTQQRRLAAGVGPDDDGEPAGWDGDRQPVEDGPLLVARDQVAPFESHRRLRMSR